MSGIDESAAYAVVQVEPVLDDGVGEPRKYAGTAFWAHVGNPPRHVLVTNKHNLDPALKFGVDAGYRLKELRVRVRRWEKGRPTPDTGWFTVTNLSRAMILHETADCAIIDRPTFELPPEYGRSTVAVTQEEIASAGWIAQCLHMTDRASFLGFPRVGQGTGARFWDTRSELPLIREATIASLTSGFTNPELKTSHVIVVAGLSFGGASGSPVISHERGRRGAGGPGTLSDWEEPYRPPKLVGIMSGHFADGARQREVEHSGLSYFTSSAAIHDLISRLR